MCLTNNYRQKETPILHNCSGVTMCWCSKPSDYWPVWVKTVLKNETELNIEGDLIFEI